LTTVGVGTDVEVPRLPPVDEVLLEVDVVTVNGRLWNAMKTISVLWTGRVFVQEVGWAGVPIFAKVDLMRRA
jgi:hypothetical protein